MKKWIGLLLAMMAVLWCTMGLAEQSVEERFAVGEYVEFGSYLQTATGNERTPIEWVVIGRDGSKALLLSRYVLESRAYHVNYEEVRWENSSIRSVLNGTFLSLAFNRREQEAIVTATVANKQIKGYHTIPDSADTQDRVFLLSYQEAQEYLGVTYKENWGGRAAPNERALAGGVLTETVKTADGQNACYWWLRSTGLIGTRAAYIAPDGSMGDSLVNNQVLGVRPALWVDLASGFFGEYQAPASQAETGEETPDALAADLDALFTVGGEVKLGTYPQTAEGTDETFIDWIVLERDGDKALLISKYGLDAQPYHSEGGQTVEWKQSWLRKWLNGDFMARAFSAQERSGIRLTKVLNGKGQGFRLWGGDFDEDTEDHVFLLSYAEAEKYFGEIRFLSDWDDTSDNLRPRTAPTEYIRKKVTATGPKTAQGAKAAAWWLRSQGDRSGYAARVDDDGSLFVGRVEGKEMVRPAMWIDVNAYDPQRYVVVETTAPTEEPVPENTPAPEGEETGDSDDTGYDDFVFAYTDELPIIADREAVTLPFAMFSDSDSMQDIVARAEAMGWQAFYDIFDDQSVYIQDAALMDRYKGEFDCTWTNGRLTTCIFYPSVFELQTEKRSELADMTNADFIRLCGHGENHSFERIYHGSEGTTATFGYIRRVTTEDGHALVIFAETGTEWTGAANESRKRDSCNVTYYWFCDMQAYQEWLALQNLTFVD